MKAEYIEGRKARENFERLAKALFQVPKKRPKQAAYFYQNLPPLLPRFPAESNPDLREQALPERV
jgi:hypothetical protein